MVGRRQSLFPWLALLVILAAATPAGAARFHVRVGGVRDSGPSEAGDWALANCYATLAVGASAAAPGDSVLLYPEVHACAEPVVLPAFLGNRYLDTAPESTHVACEGSGRLVLDAPASHAELRGVTFTGGASLPQAGLTVGGTSGQPFTVVVRGCDFRGFSAQGTTEAGGSALRGAANVGGIALQLDDCEFADNRTEGPGGAVFAAEGVDLAFTDCRFTGNECTGPVGRGGAVAARSPAEPTTVSFIGCDFQGNISSGPGGAISTDNVSLHLVGSRIEGSRSGVDGLTNWSEGAGVLVHRSIGLSGQVVFEASGCTFHDNVGSMLPGPGAGDGGAVLVKGRYFDPVEVTVSHCDFTANYNTQGAGLYVGRFATGSVRYCSFVGNRAWYQGGGAMKGGAFATSYGELIYFDYCEFVDNEAGFTPEGAATGEYSRGGGLMIRYWPRALVRYCTFVDNRVNDSGYTVGDGFAHASEGGYWRENNQCVLLHSVFWGEGGNDVQVRSEDGGIAEASGLALAPGQFSAPGAVEESFVWLTAYPLTAADDLVPAAGSPLIDQGLDLGFTVSLQGVPVPQGAAPDIGAYERPAEPSAVAEPTAPRTILAAHPNPFNPRTSIAATVPSPGDYRLVVHDLRGRAVARLHAGRLTAGRHAWSWEGLDDAGRSLPAGVYLVRLTGTGLVAGRKLVLVR